jgi:hypothetical protein
MEIYDFAINASHGNAFLVWHNVAPVSRRDKPQRRKQLVWICELPQSCLRRTPGWTVARFSRQGQLKHSHPWRHRPITGYNVHICDIGTPSIISYGGLRHYDIAAIGQTIIVWLAYDA